MSPNFEAFYSEVFHYFQYNMYIGITLAGLLLLLLFRKPKLFFTLVFIAAMNISLLYVISYTSSLGEVKKKSLLQKGTIAKGYEKDLTF